MRFRASHIVSLAVFAGLALMAPLPGSAQSAGETTTHDEADNKKPADPCFDGQGSVKEVLDGCAAYIASKPGDKKQLIKAHSIRAMAFSATGDLDAALKEMDAAVEINPERANSYFMRAAGYDAKKDYDKALADLDKAIDINGKDADYYMLRGLVHSHKRDYDKALADLNEKVKLDPKAINGYTSRADLYRQRKEYDLSVADYSEALNLDNQNTKVYIDRGWIYVLMDDLDKAGADFDNALKLQENNAMALVGRGVVKSRKGKPTDGAHDLALAQRLEPGIFDEVRKLGVK